ncbi:peptidoglycan DD-metalloendopeptidase family protein [Candidatus Kaiserbacteria bacterium]|nr:peptidoglycan DD-metalloendopeptidase family protein [Candidatus Kaiserbacteria bacterium]
MIRAGFLFLFFILSVGFIFAAPSLALADEISDIQSQIDENNKQIEALQAEIVAFQKELNALGDKKNTLQSTISSLTLSQKKLASEIKVTQNKIASANFKIKELTLSIGNKETTIAGNQKAIAKTLRVVAENERVSLVTQIISAHSLRDAWQAADHAMQFNRALASDISDLRTVREELTTNRDQVTATKASLVALQNDLALQKRSVDANKMAQQQLLLQTKNQESNYQKLIAQKQAAEKEFEQELINLQGQLNLIVNPSLLPKVGSGVLGWTFNNSFMLNCAQRKKVFGNPFCISQFFGNTAFATANPQIYKGKGHNAIDIAASIGTPVQAALSGTVLGTGNTDLVIGCYSFGKWIMIVHGNGLSTLYSHLSAIDVVKGQQVSTGQIIGLSGMTGYATGPHIHFGVYATDGTQIMTLRQFRGATIGCADATMPVAVLSAYLNPLSYL